MNFLKVFMVFVININLIFGANILYVVTIASPSHHIWNEVLASELGRKGHNVTYISADKEKSVVQNVKFHQVEGIYEALHQEYNINDFADFGSYEMLQAFLEWSSTQCSFFIKSNVLKDILNYPKGFFDLIIIDVTAGPCYLPLIHKFNYPPTVAVTPFIQQAYVSYHFDKNLMNYMHVPWYALNYNSQMSFLERVWSFVFTHVDVYSRFVSEFPSTKKISNEVFGENIPPYEDLFKHISLLLANTDPLLDYPRSLPPNIISVGGLHAGRTNQKIPDDLLKLLDNAKDGVILFSLGTNVRSNQLSVETRTGLLEAFRQIPQLVIWKFESDLDGLPKNVIIRNWLPQNAILAHPNVKLFIGHGGALSTQEAIYHGVPMIGVPFMVDQNLNTRLIVEKKLGVKIDFRLITKDYVLEKLKEVLNNPIYAENMKRQSKQFRDKPQTPLQKATFWIEFVLRNGDTKFFETRGRELSYLQASGLDVIGFLFLILFGSLFLCFKAFMFVIGIFKTKEKLKKA